MRLGFPVSKMPYVGVDWCKSVHFEPYPCGGGSILYQYVPVIKNDEWTFGEAKHAAHIYIYIFFFPLHLYHDIPIHQHPAIQLYMFHGYQCILYLERNQIVLEGAGTRGPGAVRCVRGQPWIR